MKLATIALERKYRLLELADVISQNPERFDMTRWYSQCGTAACIAGWALWRWAPNIPVDDIPGKASELLHLNPNEAGELFAPIIDEEAPDFGRDRITNTQAAATLRRLAETGEVVW